MNAQHFDGGVAALAGSREGVWVFVNQTKDVRFKLFGFSYIKLKTLIQLFGFSYIRLKMFDLSCLGFRESNKTVSSSFCPLMFLSVISLIVFIVLRKDCDHNRNGPNRRPFLEHTFTTTWSY